MKIIRDRSLAFLLALIIALSTAQAHATEEQDQLKALKALQDEVSATITNPYHPWFDPDNFRFENYSGSHCIMSEVLAKLFPQGTDKAFVDRVLVQAGGARAKRSTNAPNKYSYFIELDPHDHSPKIFMTTTWNIAVHYDETQKVGRIEMQSISVYDYHKNCVVGEEYGRNWRKQ